jgi:prepilin-type processing-associated H-X9-DG protein
MSAMIATVSNARRLRSWGFSLAELLVVVGIMSLLAAITLPPLQLARRKAMEAKCSAQLQQLGRALESARSETGFYPLWDDAGTSTRYTWIDVLIQRRLLGSSDGTGQTDRTRPRNVAQIGYCPADRLPDPLNAARHNNLVYPLTRSRGGVDYSYGIGVPLSAGGWAWRAGQASDGPRPRRFRDHDHHTTGRVLAGDACASAIYNLSGQALSSGIWNDPTQFDNTVAWARHPTSSTGATCSANLLFQDGHVSTASYARSQQNPLNTAQAFVWYPGEPLHVGPADHYEGNWYPNQPPPGYEASAPGDVFPAEMTPRWYTQTQRWTLITHK